MGNSQYNLWRQVLEYFDAFIIGLTATPSKQTLGFFNQNLVMEYSLIYIKLIHWHYVLYLLALYQGWILC